MASNQFVIENGILIKYKGDGGNVAIPNTVRIIGEEACTCPIIMQLSLPDTIIHIERAAFCNCMWLEQVVLPDGVTYLGDYAFSGCTRLERIFIPTSVVSIGNRTFDFCNRLTIYAPQGSCAESYAKKNNIPFVASECCDFKVSIMTDENAVVDEDFNSQSKTETEKKLDALYKAVNSVWDNAFNGWPWEESDKTGVFILGEPDRENGFAFFLEGCEDRYGGWIWIEYAPEKDIVGVYIKNRPIQEKLKDGIDNLFKKYAPFDMRVVYEDGSTPIIMREEKVDPADFMKFFNDFRKAYDEYYPLFYAVTVSAKSWYDGFCITGADC